MCGPFLVERSSASFVGFYGYVALVNDDLVLKRVSPICVRFSYSLCLIAVVLECSALPSVTQ